MDNIYLIKFAHTNIQFRFCELESLASLFEVKLSYLDYNESYPYLVLKTDCFEKLKLIVQRSFLISSLFLIIGYDVKKDEFIKKLKNNEIVKNSTWSNKDESFQILIESFNKKCSIQEKLNKIDELKFLNFQGKVDLKNPNNIFYLIECFEHETQTKQPIKYFFAKFLMNGSRGLIDQMSLSKRKFISNTSMDVTLSFIMSNLAKVKENDLVLDLFVGSGSLLVAAAKLGAYVLGCDIDFLLLNGLNKSSRKGVKKREQDESVRSNLKQYNLEHKYIDVIVSDSSLPLWRENIRFDSIITDPPYGIRESALKIGSHEPVEKIPEKYLEKHIPKKIEYNLYEVLEDLLSFSSVHLNLKGNLVFWYPLNKSSYDEEDLPKHPCFRIVCHSAQTLSGRYLRILICLEKIKEPVSEYSYIPECIKKFRNDYHKKRNKFYSNLNKQN